MAHVSTTCAEVIYQSSSQMNYVSLAISFPELSPSSPCGENPGNEVVSTSDLMVFTSSSKVKLQGSHDNKAVKSANLIIVISHPRACIPVSTTSLQARRISVDNRPNLKACRNRTFSGSGRFKIYSRNISPQLALGSTRA